ncbi:MULTISPECIES: hypothetical protein [Actinoalloteichus]|uniref:Uncharacterized protein n=1 Tax=Actinoalloteichus fjordicus TaxID=1612552 RepID=A0AAC9LGB6_9PSEU|nr:MULTISPECIES: hypothetical protein [Actinoalloteichus]APU16217.1 hypothetical protein UA74_20960 [Actinoalloteichus fjordicus]APU22277.1 hypothetical protein UA75_21440 [Actinoalloteichus sp. GBA129-24]
MGTANRRRRRQRRWRTTATTPRGDAERQVRIAHALTLPAQLTGTTPAPVGASPTSLTRRLDDATNYLDRLLASTRAAAGER